MLHQARYHVVKIDREHGLIWIVDDNGPLSVTNDAPRVVSQLYQMYGSRRIYYKDSAGNWDELVHVEHRFVAFAPARHVALTMKASTE